MIQTNYKILFANIFWVRENSLKKYSQNFEHNICESGKHV